MNTILKQMHVSTKGIIGYIAAAAMILTLPSLVGQDDAVTVYLTVAAASVAFFVLDVVLCLARSSAS